MATFNKIKLILIKWEETHTHQRGKELRRHSLDPQFTILLSKPSHPSNNNNPSGSPQTVSVIH